MANRCSYWYERRQRALPALRPRADVDHTLAGRQRPFDRPGLGIHLEATNAAVPSVLCCRPGNLDLHDGTHHRFDHDLYRARYVSARVEPTTLDVFIFNH